MGKPSRFCNLFNIDLPIVQGAMAGVSHPTLVASVSNNGGLGILPLWPYNAEQAEEYIAITQSKTARPFAINLRADLDQIEHIERAANRGIEIFNIFWGESPDQLKAIEKLGGKSIITIGSPEAAQRACDMGASALILQGVEAGGHVLGEIKREVLLDKVLKLDLGLPLISGGGLSDSQDVSRTLDLGADAVLFGTRFAMTEESFAHPDYKKILINATAGSTIRTTCYDIGWPNAPHRVIFNSTCQDWEQSGRLPPGQRPGEGDPILKLENGDIFPRYFIAPPGENMTGTIEAAALYAGMGVSQINQILPVKDVIDNLMASIRT